MDFLLHSKEMDITISHKGSIDLGNLGQNNSAYQKYLLSLIRSCLFLVPANGRIFPREAGGGLLYKCQMVISDISPGIMRPEQEFEKKLAYYGNPTHLIFSAEKLFHIRDIDPLVQREHREKSPNAKTNSSETGPGQDTIPDDESISILRSLAGRGTPVYQSSQFDGVPVVFQSPDTLFLHEFCMFVRQNLPSLRAGFQAEAMDETIRMYVSYTNETETAKRLKTKKPEKHKRSV